MATSRETYQKREKQKKRQQQQQEKAQKRQERKAMAVKGKPLEAMIAYLDENGNIVDTPPEGSRRNL